MNRIEEIILEINGKISYADTTGNHEAKEDFLSVKSTLMDLNMSRSQESLCETCEGGGLGNCFCKPTTVLNKKVVKCDTYRKDEESAFQRADPPRKD